MALKLPLLFSFICVAGMWSVVIHRSQFLISLIGLEGVVLVVALVGVLISGSTGACNGFVCVVILTFGACDASVGLAVVVLMSRCFGSDMVKCLTVNNV